MARGKKQFKVVQTQSLGGIDIDQEELMNMFQQLTGDPTKLDPTIISDKFERLKNAIQRCNKLLRKFKLAILDRLVTKIGVDPFFDCEIKNLDEFLTRSENYISDEVTPDNMIHLYQATKESFVVEEYLRVCKSLRQCSECIKDRTNLSDKFILRAVGDELILFPFAKFNFKHLFNHILAENITDAKELSDAKTYILLTLNMLYITTQDIYSVVSTPDVDISKLSEMIVQAIGAAKKQIPRCDRAFRLIENSVDMLKNGMGSYYKDFVASGNPAVIFENFISDLSNDLDIDTQTMSQFKRIIFHFRKRAESMPKKAVQLSGVFSTLDKIMGMMEEETTSSSQDDLNDEDDGYVV